MKGKSGTACPGGQFDSPSRRFIGGPVASKGSHRNFFHPKVAKPVTLAGKPGDDVKQYQERAVKRAIEESKR